jgi:hypothetical protein
MRYANFIRHFHLLVWNVIVKINAPQTNRADLYKKKRREKKREKKMHQIETTWLFVKENRAAIDE